MQSNSTADGDDSTQIMTAEQGSAPSETNSSSLETPTASTVPRHRTSVLSTEDEPGSTDDAPLLGDARSSSHPTNKRVRSFESWVTDARVILASFVMFLALVLAVVIVVFVENHVDPTQASRLTSHVTHGESLTHGRMAPGTDAHPPPPMVLAGSPGGATEAIAPEATALAAAAAAEHTNGVLGKEWTQWSAPGSRRADSVSTRAESGSTDNASAAKQHLTSKRGDLEDPGLASAPGSASASWSGWESEPLIQSVFDQVVMSPSDRRHGVQYREITLTNGLRALVVTDSQTPKACAAVNVKVGSFQDPPHLQGLSHLLEHMLFLGTERHPEENGFATKLSRSGGSSNAYTDLEDTNYFFDVQPNALKSTLQHFAEFFTMPLLSPKYEAREVNVVDAEHTKNLRTDAWREVQLLRSTSNPHHPYHKFGTGNRETLQQLPAQSGINVTQALRNHFLQYYTADKMSVVVVGRESLHTLQTMVVSYFGTLTTGKSERQRLPAIQQRRSLRQQNLLPSHQQPLRLIQRQLRQFATSGDAPNMNSPVTPSSSTVPVRLPQQLGLLYRMRAVSQGKWNKESACEFVVKFLLPFGLEASYHTKPATYVENILGTLSPGSLAHFLRQKDFASTFTASVAETADSFSWFEIRMKLTARGQADVEEVFRLTMGYIEMMKQEGPKLWRWEELRKIADAEFKFSQRPGFTDFVSTAARRIRQRLRGEVVSGDYLYSEWNPELIQKVFDCLCISNAVAFLIGTEPPDFGNTDASIASNSNRVSSTSNGRHLANEASFVQTAFHAFEKKAQWMHEAWYGTEYTVSFLPGKDSDKAENLAQTAAAAGLRLPSSNAWITSKFEFVRAEAKKNIKTNQTSHIWTAWQSSPPSQSTSKNASTLRGDAAQFDHVNAVQSNGSASHFVAPENVGRVHKNGIVDHENGDFSSESEIPISDGNAVNLLTGDGGCRTFWMGFNKKFDLDDPRIYIEIQFSLPSLSWDHARRRSEGNTSMHDVLSRQIPTALSRSAFELQQQALLMLYVRLLEDSLLSDLAQPITAGFDFAVSATEEGFDMSLSGFPQKLTPLLSMIASRAAHLSVDPPQFERIRAALVNDLRDWPFDMQPFMHAKAVAHRVTSSRGFLPPELSVVMSGHDGIDLAQFLQFQSTMFPGARVEMLAFGNANRDTVMPLVTTVNNSIPSIHGETCDWKRIDARLLRLRRPEPHESGGSRIKGGLALSATKHRDNDNDNAGSKTPPVLVQLPTFDGAQDNSAVAIEFQLGPRTVEADMAAQVLFNHVLSEEFFHQLRTVEMLGYIVGCHTAHRQQTFHSLVCIVQTPYKAAATVTSRITEFMHQFAKRRLLELSEAQLQQLVGSLIEIKAMPPASSESAVSVAWREISSQQYNFHRANDEISSLSKMSKEDLVAFFRSNILGTAGLQPQWLAVELQGHHANATKWPPQMSDSTVLRSLTEIRSFVATALQNKDLIWPLPVHNIPHGEDESKPQTAKME